MKTGTAPAAPGALPLIGHAGRLARDRLGFLEDLRALGPVVRIRLGRTPVYVVNSPELVQRMLVAGNGGEFDKGGPFFDQAAQLVGNGLSTAPAGPHRPMRALLRPVFARHRLPHHTERFRDCALEVSSAWRPGQVVDAYTEMKRFAVTVLARTLFLAPEDRQAVEAVQRNVPLLLSALATHMMVPGSNRLPTLENLRYARAARETRQAVGAMVRRRMSDRTDHGDLMSALVPPDHPAAHTEQEVYDQVITFFIGGTETMAGLLSWTLHLLTGHPREYERLEAELSAVLGDGPVTHQDLRRLEHMKRVLNESLRLHPPVWLLSRVTLVDTELGGHRLPAGAGVLFSPYSLHRDPAVFAEPERFDPDRWLDARVERRQREAFLPFGAGARRCIGDAFGLAEAQVALAVLLRRWRVRPLPGSKPEPLLRMTMRPQGVRLVLDRRAHRAGG
ncbi:pentalenene oxygenase [Streptomyces sp. cf386]|uniref:cytochrome P450 n=1 Tax=Streptomyces sp. cf386 TaxID=1761904 RepID=UPI00088E4C0C|nr:cytochrome P450 [Streptomyces sp. cf386]SDM44403.1 pentalenene oxygenase [Streptomyces sp. cf386]